MAQRRFEVVTPDQSQPRTLKGDTWDKLSPRQQNIAKALGIGALISVAATIGFVWPSGTQSVKTPTGRANFDVVGLPFRTTPFPAAVIRGTITESTTVGYGRAELDPLDPGSIVPDEQEIENGALIEPNTPSGEITIVPKYGPSSVFTYASLSTGASETIGLGDGQNGYAIVISKAARSAGRTAVSYQFGPASGVVPIDG
jgi:hypothetical protein